MWSGADFFAHWSRGRALTLPLRAATMGKRAGTGPHRFRRGGEGGAGMERKTGAARSGVRRVVRRVLLLVLTLVMAVTLLRLWRVTERERRCRGVYEALRASAPIPEAEEAGDGLPWPEVDFPALLAENPDTVAWLYSPETPIHYPVVRGADNETYLHRLFDGTPGHSGTIFLESQNARDFSDPHSILYGHHMRDGSMFKSLKGYQEQSYYEAHPWLLLVTPAGRAKVELFSGYVARTDSDAWQLDFANLTQQQRWLEEQRERSAFESAVEPHAGERILTLSTCSYEFKNARFVVHGVLRWEE